MQEMDTNARFRTGFLLVGFGLIIFAALVGRWVGGDRMRDVEGLKSFFLAQEPAWYGPDLFLQEHGGQAYEEEIQRERLDLKVRGRMVSLFIAPGDRFVWTKKGWAKVGDEENTGKRIILSCVDRNSLRLVLQLTGSDGRTNAIVEVSRRELGQNSQSVAEEFSWAGFGPEDSFTFLINDQPQSLEGGVWLIREESGAWRQIRSVKDLDDYVERKLVGELFVIDSVADTHAGTIRLSGRIYDETRARLNQVVLEFDAAGVEPLTR